MKSTKKHKLIDTNQFLKDRQYRTRVCLRNAVASCHIESVYCKNLEKKLATYRAVSRKAR